MKRPSPLLRADGYAFGYSPKYGRFKMGHQQNCLHGREVYQMTSCCAIEWLELDYPQKFPQKFPKLFSQSVGGCGIIHGGFFFGFDTPYYTGFPKRKPFSFQYCIIHQKTNDATRKHGYIMAEGGELPVFRRILTYPKTQIVCYKCKYQRNYSLLINNGNNTPHLHQKMGIVQACDFGRFGLSPTLPQPLHFSPHLT